MSNRRRFVFALMLIASLVFSACGLRVIRGSGVIVSETRQVSNFDSIDLSGSGEVILTQGNAESLKIEADDNLMQYVEAVVRAGTLELGFKDGVNIIQSTKLVFYVEVDDLTGLAISGSGDFEADRIETDQLNATVSGSGDIQIAELKADYVKTSISGSGEIFLGGVVETQEIRVSGSGKYIAGGLCSERVTLDVSGSGNATVCATGTLDVDISGSGNVSYYGQPSVHSSTSGSGTINSLGDK